MKNRWILSLIGTLAVVLFMSTSIKVSGSEPTEKIREICLMPFSHLDIGWKQTVSWQRRNVHYKIIKEAMEICLAKPEFKFTIEHVVGLQSFMDEATEEERQQMLKFLKEGRIELCGQWVHEDFNLISGESIARQMLYGKRWYMDNYGLEQKSELQVDQFGRSAQLAQLEARAGYIYSIFDKNLDRAPYPGVDEFYQVGLDGSEILSYYITGGYGWGIRLGLGVTPDVEKQVGKLQKEVRERAEFQATPYLLVPVGSDWRRPPSYLPEFVKAWNETNEIKAVICTASEFMEKVAKAEKEGDLNIQKLPRVYKEWQRIHEGRYSLRLPLTTQRNGEVERLLLSAEKFNCFARLLGERTDKQEELNRAWKIMHINQGHDGIPGAALDNIAIEMEKYWDEASAIGNRLLNDASNYIVGQMDFQRPEEEKFIPIVVFNPLSWERKDIVKMDNVFFPEEGIERFKIVDGNDKEVPYRITSFVKTPDDFYREVSFVFLAKVPSLGYSTYYLLQEEPAVHSNSVKVSESKQTVENQWYKLVWDKDTKLLCQIEDKKNKIRFDSPSEYFFNEIQSVKDIGDGHGKYDDNGSIFELLKEGLKLEKESEYSLKFDVQETGPIYTKVSIEGNFLNSKFIHDIFLYNDINRIDFVTNVDWQGMDKSLNIVFPFRFENPVVYSGIPYGTIERPYGRYPLQGYVELYYKEKDYGVALITQDLPDYDASTDGVVLQVLRSVGQAASAGLANCYEFGKHAFRYSLFLHKGNYQDNSLSRKTREFLYPLLGVQAGYTFRYEVGRVGEFLPSEFSFVNVIPEDVIIEAMKRSYDGDGYLLRLYESEGKEKEVKLVFSKPIKRAWRTDIIEKKKEPLKFKGNTIILPIRGFSIESLNVIF